MPNDQELSHASDDSRQPATSRQTEGVKGVGSSDVLGGTIWNKVDNLTVSLSASLACAQSGEPRLSDCKCEALTGLTEHHLQLALQQAMPTLRRVTDELICNLLSSYLKKMERCSMPPNDPKLSHGANNRKRGFASKCKIKEQPPLAPARC
jgi:hypothetical protein